jgi:hypothetical protein
MTHRRPGYRRWTAGSVFRLVPAAIALLFPVYAAAQMGQVPQVPAFLPTVDQVAASQVMPLDGTWLVSSIRKKIRIEAGRAYAVDGWTHLFVLNIQPGMVVIRDVVPTGPGAYAAEDLPLMGKWTAKVQPDRSLAVTVAGAFGPASYKLIPVQIDNPQWYAQGMEAAGLAAPAAAPARPAYPFTTPGGGAPSPQEPSDPAASGPASGGECMTEQYDPKTDTTVCMDGRQ